jgi:hypothetical protein
VSRHASGYQFPVILNNRVIVSPNEEEIDNYIREPVKLLKAYIIVLFVEDCNDSMLQKLP